MIKYVLTIILMIMTTMPTLAVNVTNSPGMIYGKMENGPSFMLAEPLNVKIEHSDQYSTVIKAGVGFTAARAGGSMNHHSNRLMVRNEFKIGDVVAYSEFNWFSDIEGATNDVSYFQGTYQAVGFRFEF